MPVRGQPGVAGLGWRDQSGVTLVELTVVAAFLAVILIATVTLWQKTQMAYFQGAEAAEFQGNLRVALDQIAHDVRRAGRDLTNVGFDPIPTATATTLEVKMDLNDDGAVTANSDEDVSYAFNAAAQRITRNGLPLAESIGNVAYTYWWSPVVGAGCGAGALASGQTPSAAQRQCVRRVTITVTGQSTIGGEVLTRQAQTDVDLRNR